MKYFVTESVNGAIFDASTFETWEEARTCFVEILGGNNIEPSEENLKDLFYRNEDGEDYVVQVYELG